MLERKQVSIDGWDIWEKMQPEKILKEIILSRQGGNKEQNGRDEWMIKEFDDRGGAKIKKRSKSRVSIQEKRS